MRYCMNFYLNWYRNYAWSNFEVCFLLSKYQSSSFDHAQFLCQLRQKFIQYLILKLLSMVKRDAKGQRMLAFLCGKIASSNWAIQYINVVYSFSNEHHCKQLNSYKNQQYQANCNGLVVNQSLSYQNQTNFKLVKSANNLAHLMLEHPV